MRRLLSSLYSRVFSWVIFAHSLLFIIFWLTNRMFYTSTNDFLADMLGKRLDYVSLLVWASALIAAWSCLRGILSLLRVSHRLQAVSAWFYGIIGLVFIIFFYGSFYMLFSESPVQLVRIGQLIGYFRIVLDGVLLVGLAALAAYSLRVYKQRHAGNPAHWPIWAGVVIGLMILWSLPLIFPRGSVVRGELPPKPFIIAHRGASMLAPENTLAAAELAVRLGTFGLETDIQVSQDGQLFLMHDETMARTTDVAVKFPGREKEPAEDFTLAEISQLNAGDWFVKTDPYGAIKQGLVTPEQVQEYRQQSVPLLADWLKIIRQNGVEFIFDLKQPPASHPYADSFFALAFDQVRGMGADPLIWLLVTPDQVEAVRQRAPYIWLVYGADYRSLPNAAQLKAQGYQIVNVEYGISPWWIRSYRAQALWVNVYTVDETWQFSRLWLLGVNSITTSNVRVMMELERPIFSLPWNAYLGVWAAVGLVSLGLVLLGLGPRRR